MTKEEVPVRLREAAVGLVGEGLKVAWSERRARALEVSGVERRQERPVLARFAPLWNEACEASGGSITVLFASVPP